MSTVHTYKLGSEVRITFTPDNGEQAAGMSFVYLQPDGTTGTLVPDWNPAAVGDPAHWSVNWKPTQAGLHGYEFVADDPDLGEEGQLWVEAVDVTRPQPPDPKDLRVVIPRVKRALMGPARLNQDKLTDSEIYALAADAAASAIMLCGGSGPFGSELIGSGHDPIYGAPTVWKTSVALSFAAQEILANEAAIMWFFHQVRDEKISQRIQNEGREWEWAKSSTLLRDHLKSLTDRRDLLLQGMLADAPVVARYVSYLQVRDREVAARIEPFTNAMGVGGIG